MRRLRCAGALAVAVALLAAAPVCACLWDLDTLLMERQRFPTALELITGKFLRHTPEFYAWRIADRERKLKTDPDNLALLDDLAVATEKTGDHARAIEIALRQDKLAAGRYETLANLGTFYLHAGELATGRSWIERALQVNPQAHFGREIYQSLLVKYLLQRHPDGKLALPLDPQPRGPATTGFGSFVMDERKASAREPAGKTEVAAAVAGVLGMMKFGSHEHPALLEALGDLLLTDLQADAKQLAARAYLKASYAARDGAVAKTYRELAAAALSGWSMQSQNPHVEKRMTIEEIEAQFRVELADAQAWYAEVRADELRWIQDGRDVEREFETKYYREPAAADTQPYFVDWMEVGPIAIAVFLIALIWALRQVLHRWRTGGRAGGRRRGA